MKKPGYAALVLLFSATLVGLSGLLFVEARRTEISIPVFFDTPYHAFRSVLAIAFLTFFMVLMARHVTLFALAVWDQVVRRQTEKKADQGAEAAFAPLVSIIAPAYNEGKCIEASIRSLLILDYPRYEVLVIDDGSSDDTLERARTLEGDYGNARVQVLWKPNGGKSTALNFGIERAAGDFFVAMDSDSVLTPDTLKEAVKYFTDPDVGAVAGAVEVVNTQTLWGRLQYLEYLKGLNLVRRAQGVLQGVSIVPGPIGMFRRSAVLALGGYTHDTFAEDCDLTLRLLLDEWKICYEPGAIAKTEAPEELIPLIKQRYRWTRGILQALKKHKRVLLGHGPLMPALMLWYMVFEALLWPIMTAVTVMFIVVAGLDSAISPAAAYFWAMLLLLDMATTLYCVAIEEKSLALVFFAPFERLIFTIMLDVCRILASVEEFAGLKMSWGKLDRKGLS